MVRTERSGNTRRRLSQNFLTDPATARRVVRLAGVDPGGLVLEVGPGDGALTRFLAPAAGRLTAYEIDPRLAGRISRRHPGVRVVRADFTRARPPREPFSVVGNIPYSRTADIVRWCLAAPALTGATLITQWEYAAKRTGGHGRWSRLTVLTWPRWSWEAAGRIPRHRFHPVPRVDAGILLLRRRTAPLLDPDDAEGYRRLVELGFSGLGGSLRASLRRAHPARRVDRALEAAGVRGDTAVGFVSPDRWVTVYRHLRG
ncbi:ErmE/ErmH/ErmO/ErmR family 23S rRNA (adenine(2058)-N(6))-methyltransferase [Nocardiopsis flavescens]|uniref:23S rRNA (Adenine-N6)-dimethyltransferase n=1 Tax=Nocardiopsis flavescens TaxID=758803 RepID=A0A1M6BIA9_9ACTN|nr:ErmE/ErmH/ErmO/ErmR family 23S rRNA (adenine(2058)-N(6))-methyltransferase [Nocardiopsis flavescens]SHI48472.1 23S rRNA (adenine-N6)-dimethyltransferase [Nocardiopsis flavescens]